MNQFKRHIAFILFLAFSFPVIYQQVHVYEHTHRDADVHCHDHCHTKIDAEVTPEGISFFQNQEESTHCPLCEYKFTVNQQPEEFIFYQLFNHGKTQQSEQVRENFHSTCVLSRSSRAPPFFI